MKKRTRILHAHIHTKGGVQGSPSTRHHTFKSLQRAAAAASLTLSSSFFALCSGSSEALKTAAAWAAGFRFSSATTKIRNALTERQFRFLGALRGEFNLELAQGKKRYGATRSLQHLQNPQRE